jgi:hypothetical protein
MTDREMLERIQRRLELPHARVLRVLGGTAEHFETALVAEDVRSLQAEIATHLAAQDDDNECWNHGCTAQAPADKRVCEPCFMQGRF